MRSITEQGALDEFLSTAELAGTDFTAQKMNNIKIIHTDQVNPYLLSPDEQSAALRKHKDNKEKLEVPRRPPWDSSTTPNELETLERQSFLGWRRKLAELQENKDLLMTPFERNLEVWRQLWRVIERSDLVVQIVDARNPLLFRSEDLEVYVKEIDSRKENLLLINKADLMTHNQRRAWADYLKGAKISYKFFSAQLAKELNESRQLEDEIVGDAGEDDHPRDVDAAEEEKQAAIDDADTRILTVEELEDLFLRQAPGSAGSGHKLHIGLVGYPNVGKSSTINALIGAKKVSVSSTPGKTKHFQTINLSDEVVLCDCPGLVFPNFATTKAELVCNGILPIDQLREYTGPATIVAQRIPRSFMEAVYGIQIRTRPLEEGGTGVPTGEELLVSYARARGFTKAGFGQPDESRAARYVLKDYVSGKLLYCEPPPGEIDGHEFNRELYNTQHLPERRRLALAAATDPMGTEDDGGISVADSELPPFPAGSKARELDKNFFAHGARNAGHLSMPFNHKYTEQGRESGKPLSGRKARTMVALEKGLDPKDVQLLSGKKHFKGGVKTRKGKKAGGQADDDY